MPIHVLITLLTVVIAAAAVTVTLILCVAGSAGTLTIGTWAAISVVALLVALALRRFGNPS